MRLFRILQCAAILALVSAFGLISLIFFWLTFPYNPLEVEEPLKVLNSPVRAGEGVVYAVDYCKYAQLPATVSKSINNHFKIDYNNIQTKAISGCRQDIGSAKVPKYFEAGDEYYLSWKACYQMNPLREVCVLYRSETFEVIE